MIFSTRQTVPSGNVQMGNVLCVCSDRPWLGYIRVAGEYRQLGEEGMRFLPPERDVPREPPREGGVVGVRERAARRRHSARELRVRALHPDEQHGAVLER